MAAVAAGDAYEVVDVFVESDGIFFSVYFEVLSISPEFRSGNPRQLICVSVVIIDEIRVIKGKVD